MNLLRKIQSENADCPLSFARKCELLDVPRSSLYYERTHREDGDLANEIYEIWSRFPFYGYRKIDVELRRRGHTVNHKKIRRIMRETGICAFVPGPHTATSNPGKTRLSIPYLLAGEEIDAPHKAWQTDITYISTDGGFVYLLALIDVFSRYVVAWRLSNLMDVNLALGTLADALRHFTPEIVNFDQGSQFTSKAWLDMLDENGILPSMTGKGRCIDNVFIERFWRSLKVEEIYLNPHGSVRGLRSNIAAYIEFYNNERPHQAIDYLTPKQKMKNATLGGISQKMPE